MGTPQQPTKRDISPEATPDTASWCEEYTKPANECNEPAPLRKGPATSADWNHLNSDKDTPKD